MKPQVEELKQIDIIVLNAGMSPSSWLHAQANGSLDHRIRMLAITQIGTDPFWTQFVCSFFAPIFGLGLMHRFLGAGYFWGLLFSWNVQASYFCQVWAAILKTSRTSRTATRCCPWTLLDGRRGKVLSEASWLGLQDPRIPCTRISRAMERRREKERDRERERDSSENEWKLLYSPEPLSGSSCWFHKGAWGPEILTRSNHGCVLLISAAG